ncbi:MAG: acyl carrier protein [Acidimicrobiales bacterium]
MNSPTLDDLVDQLKELAEVDEIDPDTPILQLEDIDSLDLMELVYSVQEQYQITIDESVFDDFDETATIRMLYERLMETATALTA